MIIILTGWCGSGKSTLAKKIEADLLVEMDFGSWIDGRYVVPPKQEKKIIAEKRTQLVLAAVKSGKSVVVEGAPHHYKRYRKLFDQGEVIFLNTPIEVCRERFRLREENPNMEMFEELLEDGQKALTKITVDRYI